MPTLSRSENPHSRLQGIRTPGRRELAIRQIYGREVFNDKSTYINVHLHSYGENNRLLRSLHAHEYLQICYVYSGECLHVLRGSRQKLSAGDVFVIPPMVPHAIRGVRGRAVQFYECEFMPFFLNESLSSFTDNPALSEYAYVEPFLLAESKVRASVRLGERSREQVEVLLEEMMRESVSRRRAYRLCLKASLMRLLVLLAREHGTAGDAGSAEGPESRYREAILDTVQFISNNYPLDLHLSDAYTRAGMSQSSFSSAFKRLTGKTFVEYLSDLRIWKAMQLLKATSRRVVDVCFDVGFRDVAHFDRVFKRVAGVTPTVYRKLSNGSRGAEEGGPAPAVGALCHRCPLAAS